MLYQGNNARPQASARRQDSQAYAGKGRRGREAQGKASKECRHLCICKVRRVPLLRTGTSRVCKEGPRFIPLRPKGRVFPGETQEIKDRTPNNKGTKEQEESKRKRARQGHLRVCRRSKANEKRRGSAAHKANSELSRRRLYFRTGRNTQPPQSIQLVPGKERVFLYRTRRKFRLRLPRRRRTKRDLSTRRPRVNRQLKLFAKIRPLRTLLQEGYPIKRRS